MKYIFLQHTPHGVFFLNSIASKISDIRMHDKILSAVGKHRGINENTGATGMEKLREINPFEGNALISDETDRTWMASFWEAFTECVIEMDASFVVTNIRRRPDSSLAAVDIAGKPLLDIVAEEDRAYVMSELAKLESDHAPVARFQCLSTTGSYYRLTLTAHQRGGVFSGCRGVAVDITKQTLNEIAFEAAKRTVTAIFESNPHINVMFDSNFNVLDCNPSAIEFMGFDSKADMLAGFTERFVKSIPEFQPGGRPSIPMMERLVNAASDGYSSFETELNVNGKRVIVGIEIKRIPYGDSFALVGYIIDLTIARERERELIRRDEQLQEAIEEARAANQAKSAFLANMSHEIRTPMNSIMGFAELAREKAISPIVKEYLRNITDSTSWLLRIINDILDISKIESGKMELENVPFDLHSVFVRCQSVMHPSIAEKGLEMRVYTEPTTGKWLLGDPVRLFQALMNLLSNAVKFTSVGIVNLSSVIEKVHANNISVYFEVKDSGIGMTDDQIGKIFDPFTQADSSTTRNYGGTGLGLAITKNIVELMGGRLKVESEPGAGSTFSFSLDFESMDAPGDGKENSEINTVEKPCFDGLVLICEENPLNQQVICEHLAMVGLQTVVAENGSIGADMVRGRIKAGEKPFDLIFMDIFMPVMDGVEAASVITALETGTPIIAMTANMMAGELDNYKKSGMRDCVGKPFTAQELWRCLIKYLKQTCVSVADKTTQTQENNELIRSLSAKFAKDNINTYSAIERAVAAGDFTLSHRLAHTLKGNAGQIGIVPLQSAAAEIEALLYDKISPSEKQMNTLESELRVALEKLEALPARFAKQGGYAMLHDDQVRALLEKLENMLENINPECLNLLDDIRAVPGTEDLAAHIERCDFAGAAQILAGIKNDWSNDHERSEKEQCPDS